MCSTLLEMLLISTYAHVQQSTNKFDSSVIAVIIAQSKREICLQSYSFPNILVKMISYWNIFDIRDKLKFCDKTITVFRLPKYFITC